MKISACLILLLTFSVAIFAQKTSKNTKLTAANFSVTSIEGDSFELNKLKGKVVLLTFWSTRCAICVEEIPSLNKLAADYNGKEVVFLGLALQDEQKIRHFLKKNPFHFDILPNSFDVIMKYAQKDRNGNVEMGFPSHYLINQEGEIELITSGFDKTDTLIITINNLLKSSQQKVE